MGGVDPTPPPGVGLTHRPRFNFYDFVGDETLTEPTTWLVGDLAYYDPSGFYIRLLLDRRQGWEEAVQRLKVSWQSGDRRPYPAAAERGAGGSPGCCIKR